LASNCPRFRATPEDIRKVIRAMVLAACGGDVAAARIVLERTLGRVPVDVRDLVAALEQPQADE
jgi:hypothetical protein